MNHRKWTIITGDMIISFSASNIINWLQSVCRCSFCNKSGNTKMILRLVRALNVDVIWIFKHCKRTYHCLDIISYIFGRWYWCYCIYVLVMCSNNVFATCSWSRTIIRISTLLGYVLEKPTAKKEVKKTYFWALGEPCKFLYFLLVHV